MPPDLFCMGCSSCNHVFRACLRQWCIWNSIGSDEKLLDSPGIRFLFCCASRVWAVHISVHAAHSACWELHNGGSLTLPLQAQPACAVLLRWPSARSVCHFHMCWMTSVTSTEIFHTSVSPLTAACWNSSSFIREEMTSCDLSLLPSGINHKK